MSSTDVPASNSKNAIARLKTQFNIHKNIKEPNKAK